MAKGQTIGARLRWAIFQHQPKEGKSEGVGLLIRKLNARPEAVVSDITGERRFPGATYPSIQGYLKDAPTAPIEFLTAAAEELGVHLRWLLLNEGPRTPLDEQVDDALAAQRHGDADEVRRIELAVLKAVGLEEDDIYFAPPGWAELLHTAFLTMVMDAFRDVLSPDDDERLELAFAKVEHEIAEILAAPLRAFPGLDVRSGDVNFFARYVAAMVPILYMLSQERGLQLYMRDTNAKSTEEERKKERVTRKKKGKKKKK